MPRTYSYPSIDWRRLALVIALLLFGVALMPRFALLALYIGVAVLQIITVQLPFRWLARVLRDDCDEFVRVTLATWLWWGAWAFPVFIVRDTALTGITMMMSLCLWFTGISRIDTSQYKAVVGDITGRYTAVQRAQAHQYLRVITMARQAISVRRHP